MPRIRFTRGATVEQGDGKGPSYAAGQVLSCSVASAEYWRARGVAELTDDLDPPEAEPTAGAETGGEDPSLDPTADPPPRRGRRG